MKKVRVTDLIKKEDVEKWKPRDNILIASPMGAGKSYFCKNTLYDIAKSVKGKILMLIHRSNCVEQFQYEIEADGKSDVIEVITYQSLEYSVLHNTNKFDLSQYKFVVCDEFHYFFNDSSFNNKTAISFNMIMSNTESVHVFMSATGDHMARYMRKYIKDNGLEKAIEYEIPFDFSFIQQLTFFHKDVTMEEFLKEGIAKGDKGIFFIQSAEKAYKLYSKYKKHCVFNCSANNKKYYEYVDRDKIKDILINQKFYEQFLVTTSCFDAGINILDMDVKHIVIDIVDIGSLIQCIGRKRIQNEDDNIQVYIKIINNQKLAGLKRNMEKKIEMADFYMDNGFSVDRLIEKYPMQNDINNILYDALVYDKDGNIIPNSYTKKINEPMYFKKKEDIADYSNMLKKFDKFGYCKYLALMFGFYDEKTGRYTYRMINEDYELNSYLGKMVKEGVVLLQLKDRSDLIKKINAKQDGKLLKKAATLNKILEERNIDYRIKEFETTRNFVDENGNKKKKKSKSVWKVVPF
ncbi:MAG: DEAD/DEAH box helicase family protein [Lachnospiraceae bacterium]|nr:DEAD/DEAH box helicase family protein [Lachnospiraceae bacterium]